MRSLLRVLPFALLLACSAAPVSPTSPSTPTVPATRASDHVDTYHGVQVADPYRWLEDDTDETRAWVDAQAKHARAYLDGLPTRAHFRARLEQIWNFPKVGAPAVRGGRYFWTRNDGLQNQAVLYWADALHGTPHVLLDPNTLSKDGTVALAGSYLSHDGHKLAYALAAAGSDWNTIQVRDVTTGRDLPDTLRWVKFSAVTWNKDATGFWYNRYDAPADGNPLTAVNEYQKVCFHALGTPQSADPVVFESRAHKDWGFGLARSEDDRWLVLSVHKGAEPKNDVYVWDQTTRGPWKPLHTGFDGELSFIDNQGKTLWFQTDIGAERGRIVAVDVDQPEPAKWRTVVAESADTLEQANVVGGRLLVLALRDGHSVVRVWRPDGTEDKELALPGVGTVAGLGGERTDHETFFTFTGFLTPGEVWHVDLKTMQASVWERPQLAVDTSPFTVEQRFATSPDGTRVPVFIVHRRDMVQDGSHPTYLYAYGGFNVALKPAFSPAVLGWVEAGGVYALAILRGGGEFGRAWHEAGQREKKQNVFDDFAAVARYLVAEKFTAPAHLGIGGGSNGGLLVGASITQHPELFGAALPAVGVMDMLRFHKFTIGHAWVPEYGSSDVAGDFQFLRAYSPLHNVHPGTRYPATMVLTADHDDRVVPGHSFKFAAALQHAQAGDAPVILRVDQKAGHGAGKPTGKVLDEVADRWAFLAAHLGLKVP